MEFLRTGLNSEELADLNNSNNMSGILDMLGFDLIRDNMLKQIHGETESTVDYLDVLIGKFKRVDESNDIDSEYRCEVRYELMEFCEKIISHIASEYNIFVNIISDDYLTMLDATTTLYNFLILNRCHILEKFLINYIEQNKDALITSSVEIDKRMKDISSISYTKKNFSKEDVLILANIAEIIEFIKNGNFIDSVEFITTVNDGDYYTDKMLELFQAGTIYGNFVPKIMYNVLGDEYDLNEATRIRNSIRAHFYTRNINEQTNIESEE